MEVLPELDPMMEIPPNSYTTQETPVDLSQNTNSPAHKMPKKRKIPERTRWSSRQKTLNFTELIEGPPRLSPIPRRKHHINAPLPVLQIEGETSPSSKTSKDTDMVISVPTTSKDDNRFGLKLENDGIKCNLCSKTFKTRPSFNAHRINMHNIVVRVLFDIHNNGANKNGTT